MKIEIEKKGPLRGEITPPSDKSISHRAAIFASLASGKSLIKNYLRAADTLSTLSAMKALGAGITGGGDIVIEGVGVHGLKEPAGVVDCGNSGTTIRLLSGLLSGNLFFSVLAGDASLSMRPMARVIVPLSKMGARIMARNGDKYPPVAIRGGGLRAIDYDMPVASAQVKSALILAGLYADGEKETSITEPLPSRDHTERMLASMGCGLTVKGNTIHVGKTDELKPFELTVPGDISSAAFFIVGALLVKGSDVLVRNIGINPRRTGLLDVLQKMGADIKIENRRDVSGEPVADIHVKSSDGLRPVEVGREDIPGLVDEVPVLCIAAAAANGRTSIRGAGELRVKESDRLAAMAEGLANMGVDVEQYPDGMDIEGGPLKGAVINSFGDHRIAMAFSIAALAASGKTVIEGAGAVGISYPGFFESLKGLQK